MNQSSASPKQIDRKQVALFAFAGALLLWFAQPPVSAWMIGFVALMPWLAIADSNCELSKRDYQIIWAASLCFWLFSLQGLRHAHVAIYLGWFALSAYLSVYSVLFVWVCRRMLGYRRANSGLRIPLWLAAPVAWVGLECIRNYFATGISACMLGHTMADVPVMIQIADLFGTYGVSFVLVAANVAVFELIRFFLRPKKTGSETTPRGDVVVAVVVAAGLLVATFFYGKHRLSEDFFGDNLATFALIQRTEKVEYVQDRTREAEIFRSYARQSMTAVTRADHRIDAVVWPESMFTGGSAWMTADEDFVVPEQFVESKAEFLQGVQDYQRSYLYRAVDLQNALAAGQPGRHKPHIIGGCGVVRYHSRPSIYSGIVQIDSAGRMANWYGKMHLVMLGEYFPIVGSIPGLKAMIPGIDNGDGPTLMHVGDTKVSPNICIETAVERVTVNQVGALHQSGTSPDVVVTVTNDGWFDDSSVIDHHLRCAQLVAVGCRRPILSSANNGPTAWIDSRGAIIHRLKTGTAGQIIATPKQDERISLYTRIGDWPARLPGLICAILILGGVKRRWWDQRRSGAADPDGPLGTVET